MRKVVFSLIIFIFFISSCVLGEQKELVDEVGRRIIIKTYPPRKIISLAPSITELLFAIGQGSKVVGVTDYCNKPKEALKITKVGGFSDPNSELIIALQPDLVIGTVEGNPIELVDELSRFSIPLFALRQRNFEDILRNILSVAAATGSLDKGKELYNKLNEYIEMRKMMRVLEEQKKRMLFLIWIRPVIVPGSSSYINDIVKLSRLELATANYKGEWVHMNEEELIRLNYDVIIYVRHQPNEKSEVANYISRNKKIFKDVPIYTIDEEILRPAVTFPEVIAQLDRISLELSKGSKRR